MSIKQITRFFTLLALFLIPFFPAIVANSFFFPFITGKAFYFRILVEIAFAGWIILAFLDAKYRPRLNSLTVAVTAFAVIALIADLLGANPIRSIMSNFERMEGWLVVFHLWMFFIAITHTFGFGEEGKRMWSRWLNVSLVVAFYIACRGALQWAGKLPITQSASRPDSTLGNAAYLAVYMLIHSGIAAYMYITTQLSRKYLVSHDHRTVYIVREWVYAILTAFFAAILFSTATRGAIFGYVGGILLALALYAIFGGGSKKEGEVGDRSRHDTSRHVFSVNTWRIISVSIIVLAILSGFLVWSNRDRSFVKNNETLSRLTSITFENIQTQGRAYIWPMALKGFTQKPILGWGQENFNYIFNTNYNPKMWSQEQWFDRAHSVYLDWLVASGALGLLAYLALYFLFLRFIWKSDLRVSQKSILTGLLAGYAIHNIFVFDNLASYVPFFALLGFAVMSYSSTSGRSEAKTLFGPEPASSDVVEYVVAPIAIVLLAVGLYFWNYRVIQANTGLIVALQNCQGSSPDVSSFQKVFDINSYTANQEAREQLLTCTSSIISSQSSNQTKNAFYQLATKAIGDQIKATPNDTRIYDLAGSLYLSAGQTSQAISMLEKAASLSPNKPSIDVALANAYINGSKLDKAIELMKKDYGLVSDNGQVKLIYAAALIINKQEDYARELFNNDQSIFASDTIARVYMSLKEYRKALKIYKDIVKSDPANVQSLAQLAQAQYTAGLVEDAVATLNSIAKQYPEYTEQIKATIKQMREEAAKK